MKHYYWFTYQTPVSAGSCERFTEAPITNGLQLVEVSNWISANLCRSQPTIVTNFIFLRTETAPSDEARNLGYATEEAYRDAPGRNLLGGE